MGFFRSVRRAFTPPAAVRKIVASIQPLAKIVAPIFPPAAFLTAKPLQTMALSQLDAAKMLKMIPGIGTAVSKATEFAEPYVRKFAGIKREYEEDFAPYTSPILRTVSDAMSITGGAIPPRLARAAVKQELEEFLPEEEEYEEDYEEDYEEEEYY